MTRGLYPPDTLSKEDIATLAQVRRDIYTNAAMGGGYGMCSGMILHTGAQYARKYGFLNAKLNRNTAMLSVLGGGALGMFLFAVSTGKEEVHNLHPVFQVGAVPKGDLDYRQTLLKAKEREQDLQALQRSRLMDHPPTSVNHPQNTAEGQADDDSELDRQKMEQIRMVRRQSLMNSIEKGHGLSDSHGGHWYHEEGVDRKELEQRRLARRKSLMESFEKGHGLSDSHGGHWYQEEQVDPKV